MKKAIGMLCAAGGVLVLMYKTFDLGWQSGAATMIGSACADDPSKELTWADTIDYLSDHFSLNNAASLAGYGIGRKAGSAAFKTFSERF